MIIYDGGHDTCIRSMRRQFFQQQKITEGRIIYLVNRRKQRAIHLRIYRLYTGTTTATRTKSSRVVLFVLLLLVCLFYVNSSGAGRMNTKL